MTESANEGLARTLVDALLDVVPGAVLVVGKDGAICRANDAARALLHRDGAALLRSLVSSCRNGGQHENFLIRRLPTEGQFLALERAPYDPALRVRAAAVRFELTKRQAEVLTGLARGLSNRDIAVMLGITSGTVELHITGIFRKFGVDSRAELHIRLWNG